MEIHREVESYSTDKHVFQHTEGEIYRKGWEWTHCAYGLSKLGALQPSAKALGVGAGREPVIFWLSDRVASVTATDLYGNDTWSFNAGAEAPADIVHDATKYCPRAVAKNRIRFENADGTQLPYADGSFDLCWSLSSIEHFGGIEAAAEAIREMGRVTKSGGIVCIASEYLLLDHTPHPEYFTRREIEDRLIPASPDLRLVDGMNWALPPREYLIDQIDTRTDDIHRRRRHVILRDGPYQWTSFMLFFRKH